ncbi:MAG: alpha/beta hydrolase [Sphingomonadaceae bacterium]|nr:alpha/beta hydrolase [Sphingomonadaceae bacterium]
MVAAKDSALQHGVLPDVAPTVRPLPLFLILVQRVAERDPVLARDALRGLRIYADAPRIAAQERSIVARAGGAAIRDCGGRGPPVLLIPSLINPSRILDLAPGNSLAQFLVDAGHHVLIVDWGVGDVADAAMTIGDHVAQRLLPLMAALGTPAHLVGYCLGGTMATAAAMLAPARSLTQIAAPWHFSRYQDHARQAMQSLWAQQGAMVQRLGQLPMESLQSLFWAIDPDRTVRKFAALAHMRPDDPRIAAFAVMEDWANGGAPLTAAAAGELLHHFPQADPCGSGQWQVAGRRIDPAQLPVAAHHFTARNDHIAPAASASDAIETTPCPSGHVGMVAGSQARAGLWVPLASWLEKCDADAR